MRKKFDFKYYFETLFAVKYFELKTFYTTPIGV